MCERCGERRSVPEEIRPRGTVCRLCRVAAERERKRAKGAEYSRRWYDRHMRTPEARAKRAERERQRRNDPANRERYLASQRRWRETHRDQKAAYQARYWRKRKADKQAYANYLADHRMDYRLRAERAGRQVNGLPPAANGYHAPGPQGQVTNDSVPAEPFGGWIAETFAWASPIEISSELGISDRRIREILTGRQKTVSLSTVDRALVSYGDPGLVYVLYPGGSE